MGPQHTEAEIEQFLQSQHLPYKKYSRKELPEVVADLLAAGKIIGLHQGRMEFGPRALGGRSIIGDPRSAEMQAAMNLKIKYRESFRPFAPSVLREQVADWFELDTDSPYMLLVADVEESRRRKMTPAEEALWGIDKLNVKRSEIPAVTHVDYSARIQTVRHETNPLYWEIIEAFRQKTGCPVVVNTSFNVRGEPIVCTPEDSYRCFMRTEMDFLVLETCVLDKREQPKFVEQRDFIVHTISSVLAQEEDDFEVVVVDDGSTDNTEAVVLQTFGHLDKVRYYKQVNSERGAARNKGIAEALGKYVVFLDSDDLMRANHLSALREIIEKHPGINFLATKYEFIRDGKASSAGLEAIKEGEYGTDFFLRGAPIASLFASTRITLILNGLRRTGDTPPRKIGCFWCKT